MRTAGVDLAAKPKVTAVCTIDWSSRTVSFDGREVTEFQLVARLLEADKVGIDALARLSKRSGQKAQ